VPVSTPVRRRRLVSLVTLAASVGAVVVACSGGSGAGSGGGGGAAGNPAPAPVPGGSAHDHTGPVTPITGTPTRGATAPEARTDLYAATRAGNFSPTVKGDPALVYVPNLASGTVSVIDQQTLRVVRTIPVGAQPQHVVPSWDLKTLWVNNNAGNSLTPIDPKTGQAAGPAVPVPDPYNLYFTPDGKSALVMEEARQIISFRDPHTFAVQQDLPVPQCAGVNHADFSPDGSYLIATCEFAGKLVKVDLRTRTVVGTLNLNPPGALSAPQDIKIDPYGKIWYVADMNTNGVHEIDGDRFIKVGALATGPETHGLYPSRDGRYLYVANRGGRLTSDTPPFRHDGDQGSVSVIDFLTRRVVHTWVIAGGGTPDMGNVSADGSKLWLSGRRSNEVYVIDTRSGALLARIPVGQEPHGLAVWPLPGRYSLGHTGILR